MRGRVIALLVTARARLMVRDDRGGTAVEYALLAALIAGMIVTGVVIFGGEVLGLFQGTLNAMP